jgi:nucleotide-binding universal stress UspA family protein
MAFKTILAAVDGSKNANRTAEVAAELARRYSAKLLVLHVIVPIFEGRERNELATFARMEHMQQNEREMLQELGREIVQSAELNARQNKVTNVETLVEVGDPASVIVEIARARDADLIVLGRRGRGTLTGLLLGSVSHKVTQVVGKPCLIVP